MRILIIGPVGSGKSQIATKIRDILKLGCESNELSAWTTVALPTCSLVATTTKQYLAMRDPDKSLRKSFDVVIKLNKSFKLPT